MRETRPQAIVAQNVKGLRAATPFGERVTGEDWRDHDRRLAEALEDRDADPERRDDVRFVLVDAADCGVPQIRYRVFVAVFRRELGLVGWRLPPPTDSEAGTVAGSGERPILEALPRPATAGPDAAPAVGLRRDVAVADVA